MGDNVWKIKNNRRRDEFSRRGGRATKGMPRNLEKRSFFSDVNKIIEISAVEE